MDIECHSQQLTLHCPSLIWTHGGTPKILSLLLCEGVRLALWLYLVLQTHSDFVGSSHANLSHPSHLNLNVPPLPDIGVPAWYWLPYISGLKVENNWLRKRHSTKDPASMGHWSTCAQSLVRCVLRTVGGLISRAKTLNSKVSWSRKLLNVYKWTKLTTVLVKPPLWFVNGWWLMPSGFLRLKEIARQLQSPSSYPDPSLINSANMCKCCQVTLKVPALVPRIGRPGPFRVGVQAKQQWLKSPVICWEPNMANSDRGTGVAIWSIKRKCNLMSNSYFAWCQTMPGLKEMMQKYVQKSVNAKWHETDSGKVLVKFLCNLCITIDRADHVYLTLTLFLEAHQGFGPVAVGAACCRSSIVVLARSLDAAVPCSAVQCRVCFKCDNLFCTAIAWKMELMPEKLLGTTGHSAIRWHDETCKRGPCPPDPAFRHRIALPFGGKLGKCLWKGRDCIQLLLFNDVDTVWYMQWKSINLSSTR